MNIDVSIIVPMYEGNKYINNIFDVFDNNQKYCSEKNLELIIVNDSPWVPLEIPNEHLGCNYRLVINKENLGIHRSRIAGLDAAKGDYIIFLDQDDVLEDSAVASQLEHIGIENAVVANGWVQDNRKQLRTLFKNKFQQALVNRKSFYFYFGNPIASPGMCMMSRKCVPEAWKEQTLNNNGADDWLLWVEYLFDGNRFSLNEDKIYEHINTGNNTSDDSSLMVESSVEALENFSTIYSVNENYRKAYINKLNIMKDRKYVEYIKHPCILFNLIKWKI